MSEYSNSPWATFFILIIIVVVYLKISLIISKEEKMGKRGRKRKRREKNLNLFHKSRFSADEWESDIQPHIENGRLVLLVNYNSSSYLLDIETGGVYIVEAVGIEDFVINYSIYWAYRKFKIIEDSVVQVYPAFEPAVLKFKRISANRKGYGIFIKQGEHSNNSAWFTIEIPLCSLYYGTGSVRRTLK